jgi:hypothetical protein
MTDIWGNAIKWDGMPIKKPGLYYGIPLEKYLSAKICEGYSASSSMLGRIFNESPAHLYSSWDGNPHKIEEPESKYLTLGRASHHLLLGEDSFSTLYTVRPAKWDSWRTKDAQTWKAEQERAGYTVLVPDQLEQIKGMARALGAHPLVQAGILNGLIEHSMFWQDAETGLWLKARPDAVPNDSGDYADLKSTMSVTDYALRKSIGDFGYYAQGALVTEGAFRVLGQKNTTFSLVCVERDPPYCVRVVTIPEGDLIRGERQNRLALRLFAKCLKDDVWPGPGTTDAEMIGLSDRNAEWLDKKLEAMEKELLT